MENEGKLRFSHENFNKVCEKLKEYEDTGMSPEMVREQNRQLKACVRGELMPMPEFRIGDTGYTVEPGFRYSGPFLAECRVTGYDWDRKKGFLLIIESTNKDQQRKIFREIPFREVKNVLFKTCEEAGRKLDKMKEERNKTWETKKVMK